MAGKGRKYECSARVTFVPYESEKQRQEAYRNWVKLFLRSREMRLRNLNQQALQKDGQQKNVADAQNHTD